MSPKAVKLVVIAAVLTGLASLAVVVALVVGAVMWFNYTDLNEKRAAARAFYEQGDWDEAISSYSEVLRRDPRDATSYVCRGCAYERKGRSDLAISDYSEALRLDPNNAYAYGNRGRAYGATGHLDQAIRDEDKAILLDPQMAGNYVFRGFARALRGELDKAAADYDEAIRLDPGHAGAYAGRGYLFSLRHDWTNVIREYSEAIRLDPKEDTAFVGRAYAYVQQDECEKAIKDYREAIQLTPRSPRPYNDFAWVLATSPVATVRDGKEAVALARKACDLGAWKHSASVDTLAAAYAEVGDFDAAIKYQKQALAMADVTDKFRAKAQQRLDLYQQRKPYRETPK